MTPALLRFVGSAAELDQTPDVRAVLFARALPGSSAVRSATMAIIERVQCEGDLALRALAREFDRVELDQLEVPRAECRRALERLDQSLRAALERAARNIATAHRAFLPTATEVQTEPGVFIGRRASPLDAVGVYAPGGRGAYPSSVLMGVIPARIAGVRSVILCSPPGSDGLPSPVVLAAAEIAGADRVFALGGAGAIAAMAFGTETVPRVCRIVGPGNAYVAEAKLQVQASGAVAIDSPAGPSELLVIADATVQPTTIAREMLAQAEHDPWTSVALITDDEPLARAVVRELGRAVIARPRAELIAAALRARSAVIWTSSLAHAVQVAAEFAPEHLMLAGARAESLLNDVRNAGTVFVGEQSSVAYGDYITGANHVLPTGGAARSYSGLSTVDFMRWTTYQRIDRAAASRLASDTGLLADGEQLAGHAIAARAWGTPT
jgi:histidinol dehydrogenase